MIDKKINALNGSYQFSDNNLNYDMFKRCKAVSLPEFSQLPSRSSLFSFLHINSRSARNKIEDISNLSNNLYKLLNVIFISETWLKPNEADCNMNQYHACHLMRTCKSGGVSIYVNDSLVSVMISCNFKPVTFEYVACLLQVKPRTICVCVYRPSSTSYTIFVDELDKLLTESNQQNPGCRITLARDFNINILDAYTKSGDFIETTLSHCHYFSVYLPTIPPSNTLLDNIFLSWQCNFNSFVITVDISYHEPILAVIDDIQFNEIQSDSYLKRSYSKTNLNSFENCLSITDWSDVLYCKNACLA